MSEAQEWLNEIWSSDPALYEYLMFYEDEEPALLDALEERIYLTGEPDKQIRQAAIEVSNASDTSVYAVERAFEAILAVYGQSSPASHPLATQILAMIKQAQKRMETLSETYISDEMNALIEDIEQLCQKHLHNL